MDRRSVCVLSEICQLPVASEIPRLPKNETRSNVYQPMMSLGVEALGSIPQVDVSYVAFHVST
jgi:hypothetical protein